MILQNGKRIDGCSDTVPVGTLQPFLGLVPPKGYLACQGQLVSKITYSKLYEICGDTFGASTATHFYLPDLRGKTLAGYDENDTTMNTIGKLLGQKTHLHTTGNHTLTVAEMPTHQHRTQFSWIDSATSGSEWAYVVKMNRDGKTDGGAEEFIGGSQPHNHGDTGSNTNYQPTITVNWIVKAVMLIPDYIIVEDTLNSDSVVDALSARQGKLLNEKIENYSSFRTTETIVGYADNNEAVYRKLIEITTPSETGVDVVVGTLPAEQKGLYTMQGIVVNSASCGVPFNYYFNTENWGSIWFNYKTKEIWCVVNNPAYTNKSGHVIIEYSKYQ
jgi:microcystin-dependent protein